MNANVPQIFNLLMVVLKLLFCSVPHLTSLFPGRALNQPNQCQLFLCHHYSFPGSNSSVTQCLDIDETIKHLTSQETPMHLET